MQQALLEDGSIDRDTTERLVQAATAAAAMVGSATCSITFHRAFDCCCGNDPLDALETLIRCSIWRSNLVSSVTVVSNAAVTMTGRS